MGKAFLIRWAAALVLVMVTFNPTRYSYFEWVRGGMQNQLALKVFVGLVLAVAFVVYFRATFRSIGALGIALVLAIVGALFWVLWEAGIISFDDPTLLTWLGLIVLSVVMGVGLSWSIIRRRLSGQLDVDDVDQLG